MSTETRDQTTASRKARKGHNMKETTRIARVEIKKLIETIGLVNIRCEHITEIENKTGVSVIDCHKAINYYKYRKQ